MATHNHIPDELDVPVHIGGEGTNGNKVGISISIDRDRLSLRAAEHYLLRARLNLKLVMGPDVESDVPGQQLDLDAADWTVFENVGDTGDLSVKTKVYSTRLTFQREEVNDGELVPFSSETARLIATRTGSAKDKPDDGDSEESNESEDSQLQLAGASK